MVYTIYIAVKVYILFIVVLYADFKVVQVVENFTCIEDFCFDFLCKDTEKGETMCGYILKIDKENLLKGFAIITLEFAARVAIRHILVKHP